MKRSYRRSILDLSFNLLRSVPESLKLLTSLTVVYFVQNRIAKISGFDGVCSLTSLELGGNKLRVTNHPILLQISIDV